LGQPGMLPRQGEADMKQNNPRERARSKEVSGYQIQPMLPISIGVRGGICDNADFTEYPDTGPCVEVEVRLGLIKHPYCLVLTYKQALEADIIERG